MCAWGYARSLFFGVVLAVLSSLAVILLRKRELYFKLASLGENLYSGGCAQQNPEQPAHSRSLISAFVIRLLERIISRLATSEISLF